MSTWICHIGATDRDEFVLALRAEATGDEASITAALTLVAVAANLGELEPISAGRQQATVAAGRV